MSDEREVTRVASASSRISNFTTVLDVRRHERVASASSICISPQFWTSDEHEVTRGLSPAAVHKTYPAQKKKPFFKKSSSFSRGKPFSAALLSSHSHQLFSAIILLWSGVGGQLVSSCSSSSQQPFSATLLSCSHSQQPFSAAILSSSSQQPFSAALLSDHLAVVRGWWSAIISSCCCGQGLVVR